MDTCFDTIPRGLWFCPQCLAAPRRKSTTLTCLVTGGRSTPSTPSSGTNATQDLHSATHRWFAVKQTDSGRNPRWNVLTVSALSAESPLPCSALVCSENSAIGKDKCISFLTITHPSCVFSLATVKARKRIQRRSSRSPAASSKLH